VSSHETNGGDGGGGGSDEKGFEEPIKFSLSNRF
jgi:hypothetical protein